jgi:hypothetical protein
MLTTNRDWSGLRFWCSRRQRNTKENPNSFTFRIPSKPRCSGEYYSSHILDGRGGKIWRLFDRHFRRMGAQDVSKVFIMNFEWALNAAVGIGSPICIFSQQRGRAVAQVFR